MLRSPLDRDVGIPEDLRRRFHPVSMHLEVSYASQAGPQQEPDDFAARSRGFDMWRTSVHFDGVKKSVGPT